jgi:hypothetical protein
MPVLGAAPLPPGAVPDPGGAVRTTPPALPGILAAASRTDRSYPRGPAAGHRHGSRPAAVTGAPPGPTVTGPPLPPAGAPGPGTALRASRRAVGAVPGGTGRPAGRAAPAATPQQRWEAAVAARPLENPQPLPAAFHPLARAITGRAHPPRFTTGPATRQALAAAGALGATTGSVVHLSAPPTGAPHAAAVLAHELTHARQPVRRPRFLLAAASSLLDDDERAAVTAGRDLLRGRLPGGAAPGAAVGAAVDDVGAGIVGQLPVGAGLGAVGDVATRAARAAVIEATATLPGRASALAGDAFGAAAGGPPLPGPAGLSLPGGVGLSWPGGAGPSLTDGAGPSGSPAGPADAAASALAGTLPGGSFPAAAGAGGPAHPGPAGGAGGAAPQPAVAGTGAAGPSATGAALDADRVVELVEERLLREIERRGGRWAGVF